VFAGQLVHAMVPRVVLYLPGAHAAHVHEASGPTKPALLQPRPHADIPAEHVVVPGAHDWHDVAPASEYFPGPQNAQVVPPEAQGPQDVPVAENLPASHGVHAILQDGLSVQS
jgi:hypothetical protein